MPEEPLDLTQLAGLIQRTGERAGIITERINLHIFELLQDLRKLKELDIHQVLVLSDPAFRLLASLFHTLERDPHLLKQELRRYKQLIYGSLLVKAEKQLEEKPEAKPQFETMIAAMREYLESDSVEPPSGEANLGFMVFSAVITTTIERREAEQPTDEAPLAPAAHTMAPHWAAAAERADSTQPWPPTLQRPLPPLDELITQRAPRKFPVSQQGREILLRAWGMEHTKGVEHLKFKKSAGTGIDRAVVIDVRRLALFRAELPIPGFMRVPSPKSLELITGLGILEDEKWQRLVNLLHESNYIDEPLVTWLLDPAKAPDPDEPEPGKQLPEEATKFLMRTVNTADLKGAVVKLLSDTQQAALVASIREIIEFLFIYREYSKGRGGGKPTELGELYIAVKALSRDLGFTHTLEHSRERWLNFVAVLHKVDFIDRRTFFRYNNQPLTLDVPHRDTAQLLRGILAVGITPAPSLREAAALFYEPEHGAKWDTKVKFLIIIQNKRPTPLVSSGIGKIETAAETQRRDDRGFLYFCFQELMNVLVLVRKLGDKLTETYPDGMTVELRTTVDELQIMDDMKWERVVNQLERWGVFFPREAAKLRRNEPIGG